VRVVWTSKVGYIVCSWGSGFWMTPEST
jgi:hypothetical protein